MRILGVDPGLATIGFAVIESGKGKPLLLDVGVIKTPPHLAFSSRLKEIHQDMTALVKEYQPEFASVEQLFFSKNITTGIQVAHARGVILLVLEEHGIPYKEFTPSALKLALTGDGSASKAAIQKMLCLEMGLSAPPKPDDAADALSLALCAASQLRFLG